MLDIRKSFSFDPSAANEEGGVIEAEATTTDQSKT